MSHSIRRVQQTDAPALRTFKCHKPGEKYARDVERMVRGDLADMVEAADLEGRDMRVADDPGGLLVGVIVWSPVEGEQRESLIELLAVRMSHWRQGYGEALKVEAMALMAAGGDRYVVSKVHRQNSRMLGLNVKLGIGAIPDPEDGELRLSGAAIRPQRRRLRRSD